MTDNTRDTLRARYEASDDCPEGWVNFGDADPAPHGGLWISYDADHGSWEIIRTFWAGDFIEGVAEDDLGAQVVSVAEVQWRDIVTDGGAWTDPAQGTVKSLYGAHDTPGGAVADDHLTWFVGAFGDERCEPWSHYKTHLEADSYRDLLAKVGVEPPEGVAFEDDE